MIGWALASITAILAHGGSDWSAVQRLRATGIERMSGGVERPFTVTRGKDAVLIHSVAGIDGYLGGILRSELISSKGVYTWLSASTRYALQLPYASAPGLAGIASPIRFTKSDLTSRKRDLESRYGIKIAEAPDDTVGRRTCMVLKISDRGSMLRQFWIDKETGVALRELDRVGNDIVYDRLFTSFDPEAPLPDRSLDLPASSLVIKGAVEPDILLRALQNRTFADYATDLDNLRLSGGERGRTWLKKLTPPTGFDYVGSSISENSWETDPEVPERPRFSDKQPARNNGYNGWIVPGGQVFFPDGSMYIDTRPIGLTPAESDSIRLPNGQPAFQPLYVSQNPAGGLFATVLTPPQQQTPAEKPLPKVQVPEENTHSVIRSEFLDRSTGDTIVFLEFRNVQLDATLTAWSLKPEKLDQTGAGKPLSAYAATKPCTLHAVSWQTGGSSYLLVSSRLNSAELASLAKGM